MQRPSQIVVLGGHNLFELTECLFAAGVRHSLLRQEAKSFMNSQISNLQQEAAVVHCDSGRGQQHSLSHRMRY